MDYTTIKPVSFCTLIWIVTFALGSTIALSDNSSLTTHSISVGVKDGSLRRKESIANSLASMVQTSEDANNVIKLQGQVAEQSQEVVLHTTVEPDTYNNTVNSVEHLHQNATGLAPVNSQANLISLEDPKDAKLIEDDAEFQSSKVIMDVRSKILEGGDAFLTTSDQNDQNYSSATISSIVEEQAQSIITNLSSKVEINSSENDINISGRFDDSEKVEDNAEVIQHLQNGKNSSSSDMFRSNEEYEHTLNSSESASMRRNYTSKLEANSPFVNGINISAKRLNSEKVIEIDAAEVIQELQNDKNTSIGNFRSHEADETEYRRWNFTSKLEANSPLANNVNISDERVDPDKIDRNEVFQESKTTHADVSSKTSTRDIDNFLRLSFTSIPNVTNSESQFPFSEGPSMAPDFPQIASSFYVLQEQSINKTFLLDPSQTNSKTLIDKNLVQSERPFREEIMGLKERKMLTFHSQSSIEVPESLRSSLISLASTEPVFMDDPEKKWISATHLDIKEPEENNTEIPQTNPESKLVDLQDFMNSDQSELRDTFRTLSPKMSLPPQDFVQPTDSVKSLNSQAKKIEVLASLKVEMLKQEETEYLKDSNVTATINANGLIGSKQNEDISHLLTSVMSQFRTSTGISQLQTFVGISKLHASAVMPQYSQPHTSNILQLQTFADVVQPETSADVSQLQTSHGTSQVQTLVGVPQFQTSVVMPHLQTSAGVSQLQASADVSQFQPSLGATQVQTPFSVSQFHTSIILAQDFRFQTSDSELSQSGKYLDVSKIQAKNLGISPTSVKYSNIPVTQTVFRSEQYSLSKNKDDSFVSSDFVPLIYSSMSFDFKLNSDDVVSYFNPFDTYNTNEIGLISNPIFKEPCTEKSEKVHMKTEDKSLDAPPPDDGGDKFVAISTEFRTAYEIVSQNFVHCNPGGHPELSAKLLSEASAAMHTSEMTIMGDSGFSKDDKENTEDKPTFTLEISESFSRQSSEFSNLNNDTNLLTSVIIRDEISTDGVPFSSTVFHNQITKQPDPSISEDSNIDKMEKSVTAGNFDVFYSWDVYTSSSNLRASDDVIISMTKDQQNSMLTSNSASTGEVDNYQNLQTQHAQSSELPSFATTSVTSSNDKDTSCNKSPPTMNLSPKEEPRPSASVVSSLPSVCIILTLETTWKEFCDRHNDTQQELANFFTWQANDIIAPSQIVFYNIRRQCLMAKKRREKIEKFDPDGTLYKKHWRPVNVFLFVTNNESRYDPGLTELLGNMIKKGQDAPEGTAHAPTFMQKITEVSVYIKTDSSYNLPKFQNPEVPQFSNNGLIYATAISCIAGACLLVLCILLVIMKHRIRQYNHRSSRSSYLDAYSLDSFSISASFRRCHRRPRLSLRSFLNQAFEDPVLSASNPLGCSALNIYCENKEALEQEFKSIPINMPSIQDTLPGTETKNRYATIIPNLETRVPLSKRPSGEGSTSSDYINANFVRGYGARSKYIATQGPLPNTVSDFWRMVWEHEARTILMITNLRENGMNRCAPYFPENTEDCHQLFGDFQISLLTKEERGSFTVSVLRIHDLEKHVFRDLMHFWYTAWPLKGVPSDCTSLLHFLLMARPYIDSNPGPTVVHCSPGTGRTGVVITLDICMRELEESRVVDILQCVTKIRQDRGGLVQTCEQYFLIYQALRQYALSLSNRSHRSSIATTD